MQEVEQEEMKMDNEIQKLREALAKKDEKMKELQKFCQLPIAENDRLVRESRPSVARRPDPPSSPVIP
jgi:hypothetical protein